MEFSPRKTQSIENTKREAIRLFTNNPLFFLRVMWGEKGSVFFTPFAKFHQAIIDRINNTRKLVTVLSCPREFGKTKLISFGYIMWAVVFKKYSYILHISSSLEAKGEQIMRDLQRGFESPKFVRMFGDWHGKFWGKHKIHLYSQKWGIDCIIQMVGADQSVFGASEWKNRPDLIIIDDIETLAVVRNSDLVANLIEKFKTEIIPAAEAKDERGRQAKIIVIGTPLAPYTFLTQIASWKKHVEFIKFPALCDSISVPGMAELLGINEGESIWEPRWPTRELMAKRQFFIETGAYQTWLSQYMLDPQTENPMQFVREKLREVKFLDIQHLISKGKVITTVDLAYTEKNQNDFTGWCSTLHLPGSRMIVLESGKVKKTPDKVFELLYNLKVKYEKAEEYFTHIESKQWPWVKQFFTEMEVRTGHRLEIYQLTDKSRNKNDRIAAMIAFYEVGLIEFVEGANRELYNQMFSWFGRTSGDDDVIDAWAYQRDFLEYSEEAAKSAEIKSSKDEFPDDEEDFAEGYVSKDESGKAVVKRYLDESKLKEDEGGEDDFDYNPFNY